MKQKLLTLIVCPMCAADLSLETFELTTESEIQSGVLRCVSCATSYPVIKGIPRLLPPALQSMLWDMHPEFFRAHRSRLPPGLQSDTSAVAAERPTPEEERRALSSQLDTARSFGYEWQAFSEMLPDYEKHFHWYFERFKPEDFAGRLVLDAGCGTGRYAFYMSRTGAREVVAMDFSQAIEVAAANNRANRNTYFVQADIYHPPFRPQTFDFVYSLGVLHHLPDPERGFQSLLKYLRPDEFINLYLYWNLEGEPVWKRAMLKAVTRARQVTTRMPHAWLQRLSWVLAAGFKVAFVLPARVLDILPPTRSLADRVPLGHYRKQSFRVLYTDQFDRFSAPIENRYSRAEVAGWFERAGMRDVVILRGKGWRASGRRGAVGTEQREPSGETMQTIAG